MNKYGRCVLTGCCVLVGYGLLVWAMRMMNRPSDVSLYTGIGVVLVRVGGDGTVGDAEDLET